MTRPTAPIDRLNPGTSTSAIISSENRPRRGGQAQARRNSGTPCRFADLLTRSLATLALCVHRNLLVNCDWGSSKEVFQGLCTGDSVREFQGGSSYSIPTPPTDAIDALVVDCVAVGHREHSPWLISRAPRCPLFSLWFETPLTGFNVDRASSVWCDDGHAENGGAGSLGTHATLRGLGVLRPHDDFVVLGGVAKHCSGGVASIGPVRLLFS